MITSGQSLCFTIHIFVHCSVGERSSADRRYRPIPKLETYWLKTLATYSFGLWLEDGGPASILVTFDQIPSAGECAQCYRSREYPK